MKIRKQKLWGTSQHPIHVMNRKNYTNIFKERVSKTHGFRYSSMQEYFYKLREIKRKKLCQEKNNT